MDKFYKYSFKKYSKKRQGSAKALTYYLFDINQGDQYCWERMICLKKMESEPSIMGHCSSYDD